MGSTLGELFAAQNTDTVHHRGRIVKAVVRIPVSDGATLIVRRRGVGAPRPQSLHLALGSGTIEVEGQQGAEVVLWSNTSPEEVTLTIHGEAATILEVWNGWSMGGVDNAWIGNAGIVTKNTSSGTVLRCSDGVGEPDFSDLEVEISATR